MKEFDIKNGHVVIYDKSKIKSIFRKLKEQGTNIIKYIHSNTLRFVSMLALVSYLSTAGVVLADTVKTTGGNSYIRVGKSTKCRDVGKLLSSQIGYRIIKDEETGWDLVACPNGVGYVYNEFLNSISDEESVFDIRVYDKREVHQNVSGDSYYIRLGPGTEYDTVGYEMVEPHDYVYVYGETNNGWKLVQTYNDTFGYVYGEELWETVYEELPEKDYRLSIVDNRTQTDSPYVYVVGTGVNLRSGPSTDSKAVKIANGTKLEVVGNRDEYWVKVKYNGKEYYICSRYIANDPNSKYRDDFICVICTKKPVTLKSSTIAEEAVGLYDIRTYETCEVLDICDKYLKVRIDKFVGYVPNDRNYFEVIKGINYDIDKSDRKLTAYNDNVILNEYEVYIGEIGVSDTPVGICEAVSYDDLRYMSSDKWHYYDYPAYEAIGLKYYDINGKELTGDTYSGIYHHRRKKGKTHGCVGTAEENSKWLAKHVKIRDKKNGIRGSRFTIHE